MTQDQLKKGINLARNLESLKEKLDAVKMSIDDFQPNARIILYGQASPVDITDADTLNEVLSVLNKHLEAEIEILQREFSEL